ncbi:MAG: PQQ-dependent sugar dehydrogenase [Hymenobacter sp.]
MHFGKDGKLFVAVGENTRRDSAQRITSYFGKMLRINADGSAPSDNPYASSSSPRAQRVWSSGLRNPYTFSIEPGTDKIFVNNVGEVTWEEINDATVGGRNFGWPNQPGGEGYTANPGQTQPIYAYPHQNGSPDGTGCAITGGTFFSPANTNYPAQYQGKYFLWTTAGSGLTTSTPVAAPRAIRVNPSAWRSARVT